MVRFKNRHLLVEFISTDQLQSNISSSIPGLSHPIPHLPNTDDLEEEEDDVDLPILPSLPFMLPISDQSKQLRLGDEGGGVIYKAVRSNVLEIFGDEGWGRLSSSFKVIYHSPLTTLTILRVARQHFRTLWASLTLLREINQQSLLPRVVAISGTIKKLQNRAITYHRLITAQMLSAALTHSESGGMMMVGSNERREVERKLREGWDKEEEAMNSLQD